MLTFYFVHNSKLFKSSVNQMNSPQLVWHTEWHFMLLPSGKFKIDLNKIITGIRSLS